MSLELGTLLAIGLLSVAVTVAGALAIRAKHREDLEAADQSN